MLCAARAEVGPLGQSFWVIWDRQGRRHYARTTLRPGSREVTDGRARPRDRLARPAGQPAARRDRADRIDLPQRLRLGLDPQARRGADRGHASRSPAGAGRSRPAASTTSPPATTSATPAGAGRPASAAPPTAARSPGTWSRASTTRPRTASGRSGSRACPASRRRSRFDGMAGDRPRRRPATRLRLRVRPRPRRELPPLRLPLPPPLRQLLRLPRRPSARRGARRDGGARRRLVSAATPRSASGTPGSGSRGGSRRPRRCAGCRGRGCRRRPSASAPGGACSRRRRWCCGW